jgi:peptide/nickel transport system ATP-binding protein
VSEQQHTAELPPAKGDSDTRGRTPADVAAPPGSLLEVRDLAKHFETRGGWRGPRSTVRAVDGVSLWVRRRETLGLVGESGSGKTTTGRTLLRLIEPTSGHAWFDGEDIFAMDARALRALRRRAQIVFQDPYGSLNPRMSAGAALREVLRVHHLGGADPDRRVRDLLELVGVPAAAARRFPHQFSGGQRQRIAIARALAVEPELIVCDEPVSALDVSVQAQILNLLQDLQDRLGIAYLFIAHDLSVVEQVSARVAVMYLGRIVEMAEATSLYAEPRHPYTRALLSAVPVPDPGIRRERIILQGDIPSPAHPPAGCPFHPRCPHPLKDLDCTRIRPPLAEKAAGHFAACIKEPAYLPPPEGGSAEAPSRRT